MTQLFKFLIIGGGATALQFGILAIFVELIGVHPILASAASYSIAAIANYLANYHFTFSSQTSHWKTLPKFCVTAGIGLCLNTLLFASFLTLFNNVSLKEIIAPYVLAQCFATGITTMVNFTLHKFWIYR